MRSFFVASLSAVRTQVRLVVFLERLHNYPSLPSSHISHLGELYHLSTSSNAEIRLRFYELALKDPLSDAAKTFAVTASKWVVGNDGSGIIKGRMKFCRPIFRAIFKVDNTLAVEVFTTFKDQFHPIAKKLIEKVCVREVAVSCSFNSTFPKDLGIA